MSDIQSSSVAGVIPGEGANTLLLEHINEFAVTLDAGPELVVVTVGEPGPPGPPGASSSAAFISDEPNNAIRLGTDNGLFARDAYSTDPLVHYLLARG